MMIIFWWMKKIFVDVDILHAIPSTSDNMDGACSCHKEELCELLEGRV